MPNITRDPFDHPSFSMSSMTKAINKIPMPFNDHKDAFGNNIEHVLSRKITIEMRDSFLTLIPAANMRNHENVAENDEVEERGFTIPTFPLDAYVDPDEIENIREFSKTHLAARAELVKRKLANTKMSHRLTQSYHRMGAKKGVVMDASGKTILDFFEAFGLEKKKPKFTFNFKDPNFDVPGIVRDIVRHVHENIGGDIFGEIHFDADKKFMEALVTHPSVEKYILHHKQSIEMLNRDPREIFKIGRAVFKEEMSVATLKDKKTNKRVLKPFVEEGKAHGYPVGTMNTFTGIIAPVSFNDTVNELGKEFYSRVRPNLNGIGHIIQTASAVMPMCRNPLVLCECVGVYA